MFDFFLFPIKVKSITLELNYSNKLKSITLELNSSSSFFFFVVVETP